MSNFDRNDEAHRFAELALYRAANPEAKLCAFQCEDLLKIKLSHGENQIECSFELGIHKGTSSLTRIWALDATAIETINEAMMDNTRCRLVRTETAALLIYEPLRHQSEGCTVKLNPNRTIQDAWNLALSLWAATNEPGT